MVLTFSSRPAFGRLIQGFGPRPKPTPTSPEIHYGQDYGWGGGDAILAAAPGRVKAYSSSGAYGNRLILIHDDGSETWYCHLAFKNVDINQYVPAGYWIANMGATGNVTGKHLHFEHRVLGYAVDPEPSFRTVTQQGGGTTPINNEQEEEEDMTPEQARKLDELHTSVGILTQRVTETEQWLGIDERLSRVYRTTGEIRQLLTETEQWDGIGELVARTSKDVEALKAVKPVEIDYDRIVREVTANVVDALSKP